jgi:ABC-type branched-subunit amino acid transport system ATPase component
MIKAFVSGLTFEDGLSVKLAEDSILAVIGPNNVGKSASLANIRAKIAGDDAPRSALASLDLAKQTTLKEILEEHSNFQDAGGNLQLSGHHFHFTNLEGWWNQSGAVGTYFAKRLVSNLTTRDRLLDCDPQPHFDARTPHTPDHPFQRMYADDGLELKVSAAFRKAFKKDVVIHRSASQIIPAYIGTKPKLKKGEDRFSRAYVDRLEALDKLEQQGDGVRSMASVIGRVLTEEKAIQLIDEPEAFLHPPHAKLVAEIIAQESAGRQTFIATHSSAVIQGLLGGQSDKVSVVRLMRSTKGITATHLPTNDIQQLWRDPILRFSNVLDGLFHDGVIVTEADADCRFYEGLNGQVTKEEDRLDLHYTYSGGKDRIPVIVKAMRALKVPVVSILDFDVLNNDQPLRRIIEAHGGDWLSFSADWTAVKKAVEASPRFLGGDKFKKEVNAVLATITAGNAVSKEALSAIKKLTRNASAWDGVKDVGLQIIPSGTPTVTAKRLLKNLKDIGIFVAPHGEMEGFCRSIGGHGPRWVEEVMQRDLKTDPELSAARGFVAEIQSFLLAAM